MLSAVFRGGFIAGVSPHWRPQQLPWSLTSRGCASCASVYSPGRSGTRHLITTNRRNINRFLVSSRSPTSIHTIPKLPSFVESAPTSSNISASARNLHETGRGFSSVHPSRRRPEVSPSHVLRTSSTVSRQLLQRHSPIRILLQTGRRQGFHTSQPNQAFIPILPAAIFTLKTPVTALALRMISRVSLTLLPLSAKQSPKIILTLVMIPPVCFALVIFAGLEAAPNTGRWRFLFVNEEEELAMLQEEIPMFMESIKVIEDDNDPRVQLVRHILKNLLSTSIEQDGSTLRTRILEKLEQRHEEAMKLLKELQQQKGATAAIVSGTESGDDDGVAQTPAAVASKAIVSTQRQVPSNAPATLPEGEEDDPELAEMTFEERPFQIFVAEDEAINAFSLGPPRLIYINSGLLDWLDNDEDLVAAVVAHELAHVIQRHTMETHGRETVMLFLADLFRSALWTVSIPLGPWFNSWVDSTANNLLHFTASGPLHQTIEVEADTVSLTLLALAGYDPMHAVRLWEQWAEKDQKEMDAEDSADVHKWTDWMYDHPPSAERARYLKEAVMPAREMWDKVLKRRKEPMKRFLPLEKRLRAHVDEDGDLTEGTVQDVMETMDELLKRQEEEEADARRQSGIRGMFGRWTKWPRTSSEIDAKLGNVEPAKA
ncbi:hypothetical protein BGZ58_001249 [Dissophora ornata]|nr:hypothetical protein BGZ58_001249 [Dissophora ornata]